MLPSRKALYLVLPLFFLMLALFAFGTDSSHERMLRLLQIVKQGLNAFEFSPAP